MARYILIDNDSGFIFGDTSDFNGSIYSADSPADAARELDETIIGEHGRSYAEVSRPSDNRTGYHVYRADVCGSEAVTVVTDGQDQEMIEAVERDCQYVCFVECKHSDTRCVDIFWNNSEFTTVQDANTIEEALAKFNDGKPRASHASLSDVSRYEIVPQGQLTKFASMFQD